MEFLGSLFSHQKNLRDGVPARDVAGEVHGYREVVIRSDWSAWFEMDLRSKSMDKLWVFNGFMLGLEWNPMGLGLYSFLETMNGFCFFLVLYRVYMGLYWVYNG